MGLKRRFMPKEVEAKPMAEKRKLELVKPRAELPENEPNISLSEQLATIHQLNVKHSNQQESSDGWEFSYQSQIKILRMVNHISSDQELTLTQLMQGILEIVVTTSSAELGSLWVIDPDEKNVSCKVAFGSGAKQIKGSSIPMGKGLVGTVAQSNRGVMIADTHQEQHRLDQIHDRIEGVTINSTIVVPLTDAGKSLGVLQIINRTDQKLLNLENRSMLEDISSIMAMHLATSRAKRGLQDIQKRLNTFRDLNEDFSSTLELDRLLSIVLTRAISLLGAVVGSVWLREENGDGIECHVAEGPTKDQVIGVKVKNGMGIVGWVVDNCEPIIVEDCSKDSRFSKAMDKKIDFVTETMITVPLQVKGESIGAIQIINKKNRGHLFDQEDLDLMTLFAASSAMYIKNARLFSAEKKAKELSALIEISKEIVSTLDLDCVLMSVVNLASNIIPYQRAAISLEKRGDEGVYQLRAISGENQVDCDLEENSKLSILHNLMAQNSSQIHVNDREAYLQTDGSIEQLKDYMTKYQLQSFWGQVFEDDQGMLGIITMESDETNMIIESRQELLSILVAQSTVALRNASLYNTIPSSNILGKMKEGPLNTLFHLNKVPPLKLIKYASVMIAIVLSLIYLPMPYNISSNIEILPVTNTHYSYTSGRVQKVLVQEGQHVKKGDLLIELDVASQIVELRKKEANHAKVITEMLKARSEDRIADYKIKEREKFSIDAEIELLQMKISSSKVVSSSDGVVISNNLDDLIGMPVNFGQELIKVGNTKQLYVQFEVPEDDLSFIHEGQELKFKVFSLPSHSFGEGIKIKSVAGEARPLMEGDKDKYFFAKAMINYQKDSTKLRAGMTGRGKIYSDWQPVGFVLFNRIFRFITMELLF
ncbi:MAG: GAF domain-containing protein [Bdellovibrionales bacterium]|jgi:GAF domain-containing protein|nr:GAF domain-containing protein [Bdellovibrionales bacterium]MBT3526932.1 GAF domain-containing protein [Bdellovibrionales bacterium]